MPIALSVSLGLAWARAIWRPFGVSIVGMVLVSAVALTGQVLLRAPIMPDIKGVLSIWMSLMPEMLGIMTPVALLFASVSGSHKWSIGGEFRALAASGVTVRCLLPVNFSIGILVGLVVGLCTHGLGPLGREQIRDVLSDAVAEMEPTKGHAVEVGSVWVRADEGQTVVATDSWVAWAAAATWSKGPIVDLVQGSVKGVDQPWSMTFEGASISLQPDAIPPHNFALNRRELWSRIDAMEARGEDASGERLTAYKRTTPAILAPLMLLLGLPLGALWARPSVATLSVVIGVWAIQRIGDHAAFSIGPSGSALLPLVLLSCVTWLLWVRWRAA